MNRISFALSLLFIAVTTSQAQHTTYFSIQGGYLRSIPSLTSQSVQPDLPLRVIGINPINSFYVGIRYSVENKRLGFHTELNYQRKGMTGVDVNMMGIVNNINQYHYAGLTPTISYRPIGQLVVYVGPELNVLIGKDSRFVHSYPVEVGIAGRLGYRFDRTEVNAGIVRAFNPYAYTESAGVNVLFYRNTSLQVGISQRF